MRKPLLVIQGANDPVVKPYHAEQMVAAVMAAGVPVTYLFYPDEGHGLVRGENNLSFSAVAEQFLAQCLGGAAHTRLSTRFVDAGGRRRGSNCRITRDSYGP